jgi:hypothetical protein
MNSLAICLLILGALPKSGDTVESVQAEWVKTFSQDPAGQVEIFHVPEGCLARPLCPDQEIYTLGISKAAMETGHPVMWTPKEDEPKYVLMKK